MSEMRKWLDSSSSASLSRASRISDPALLARIIRAYRNCKAPFPRFLCCDEAHTNVDRAHSPRYWGGVSPHEGAVMHADQLFISSWRFDHALFLPPAFFEHDWRACFRRVSRSSPFSTPCKVHKKAWAKEWKWAKPAWYTDRKAACFATFLASVLETAMWSAFYNHHQIDPRKVRNALDVLRGNEWLFQPPIQTSAFVRLSPAGGFPAGFEAFVGELTVSDLERISSLVFQVIRSAAKVVRAEGTEAQQQRWALRMWRSAAALIRLEDALQDDGDALLGMSGCDLPLPLLAPASFSLSFSQLSQGSAVVRYAVGQALLQQFYRVHSMLPAAVPESPKSGGISTSLPKSTIVVDHEAVVDMGAKEDPIQPTRRRRRNRKKRKGNQKERSSSNPPLPMHDYGIDGDTEGKKHNGSSILARCHVDPIGNFHPPPNVNCPTGTGAPCRSARKSDYSAQGGMGDTTPQYYSVPHGYASSGDVHVEQDEFSTTSSSAESSPASSPYANRPPEAQSPPPGVEGVHRDSTPIWNGGHPLQQVRHGHVMGQDTPTIMRVPPDLHTLMLHHEISDFMAYVESICEPRALIVQQTARMIEEAIRKLWPAAKVQIQGSYATGLALPRSDVDLVVCVPRDAIPNSLLGILRMTAAVLQRRDFVQEVHTIGTASIPVVKCNRLVSIGEGTWILPIDLSCDWLDDTGPQRTHSGLASSELTRSWLRTSPTMKPLILVLKEYLSLRGLKETYSGGLSSYGVILMVKAFITAIEEQKRSNDRKARKAGKKSEVNLGCLLLEFLRFFGAVFVFDKMGIMPSPRNGVPPFFYQIAPAHRILMIDPITHANIGHKMFAIDRVKDAFRFAWSQLSSSSTTSLTVHTPLSRIIWDSKPLPPWLTQDAPYFRGKID